MRMALKTTGAIAATPNRFRTCRPDIMTEARGKATAMGAVRGTRLVARCRPSELSPGATRPTRYGAIRAMAIEQGTVSLRTCRNARPMTAGASSGLIPENMGTQVASKAVASSWLPRKSGMKKDTTKASAFTDVPDDDARRSSLAKPNVASRRFPRATRPTNPAVERLGLVICGESASTF